MAGGKRSSSRGRKENKENRKRKAASSARREVGSARSRGAGSDRRNSYGSNGNSSSERRRNSGSYGSGYDRSSDSLRQRNGSQGANGAYGSSYDDGYGNAGSRASRGSEGRYGSYDRNRRVDDDYRYGRPEASGARSSRNRRGYQDRSTFGQRDVRRGPDRNSYDRRLQQKRRRQQRERARVLRNRIVLGLIALAVLACVLLFVFVFKNSKEESSGTASASGSAASETLSSDDSAGGSSDTSSGQPSDSSDQAAVASSDNPAGTVEDGSSVNIVMAGDVDADTSILNAAVQPDDTYDFTSVFSEIKSEVEAADLAIVNQDTILGGYDLGISGEGDCNSPYALGDAEVDTGFDVVLQATNHALDFDCRGINNDISYWQTYHPEITVLGIHGDQTSQDTISVIEKNGIKIAILNYTYGTDKNADLLNDQSTKFVLDVLSEDRVRSDVAKAKEQADFVIVCPHWGDIDSMEVSEDQKKWCDIFLDCGVDLVMGTHPHVIETVEMMKNDSGHQMLVYYSLGNVMIDASKPEESLGCLAEVTVRKDSSGTRIVSYGAKPIVMDRNADRTQFKTCLLSEYTEEQAAASGQAADSEDYSLTFLQNLSGQILGSAEK